MAFVTGSTYDNYWVQHPIPRSDIQYSWITASIHTTKPYPAKAEIYGHAPADGYVSSSVEGVVAAYNFTSASSLGSFYFTVDGNNYFAESDSLVNSVAQYIKFIPGDFVGLNTIIYEPISSSHNTLGYKEHSASSNTNFNYKGGLIDRLSTRSSTYTLNSLLTRRNGPYQYPSWKQVRTGEHPVARKHRETNIISVQDVPTGEVENVPSPVKARTFRHYNEAPATNRYKPISLTIRRENDSLEKYRYTHGNTVNYFSNNELNNRLGLFHKDGTVYEKFYDIYTNSDPEASLVRLTYKESVYPKEVNTFLSSSRNRLVYNYTNWKTDRSSREQTVITNVMGKTVAAQSSWPLDARKDFATAAGSAAGSGSGAGVLQNGYTLFHEGSNLGASSDSTKSVKFPTRGYLTASAAHSNDALAMGYLSSSTISLWFKTHPNNDWRNVSSSLVSKGIANNPAAYESAMTYDIRLEKGVLYSNVGSVRGDLSVEISAGGSAATASFAATANLKNDHGTTLTLIDSAGVTFNFTTDNTLNWLEAQGSFGVIGTKVADGENDTVILQSQRAALYSALRNAIDYQNMQMSIEPYVALVLVYLGAQGSTVTLTQGDTGADGNTAIAVPEGITVNDTAGPTTENFGGGFNSLSDYEWHHAALSWYYKSATEHSMSLYIDGIRRASGSTGTGSAADTNTFGTYVVVGSSPPGHHYNLGTQASQESTTGYRGLMDELTFFTGSVYDTGSSAWKDGLITTLYNKGNPIPVVSTTLSSTAGPLNILSHYRMGEHANDGPLAQASGFIQDVSTVGLSAMTGNLSASVTDYYTASPHLGFGGNDGKIIEDAPFNPFTANTNIFGPLYARRTPERDGVGNEMDYFAGDTLWEAASQSGKAPFYNSYDDYREGIRGIAKDYTIVPEFRISEHMAYYVRNKNNNFLADNEDWMQLTGSAINKTSSAESGFFATYSNTDFLKHFDLIKKEHVRKGHNVVSLSLQCKAIMKFLPYDGFYPAVRTTQLANLFSSSYADSLNYASPAASTQVDVFGNQTSFRTFATPLFCPGVLYNSIKSGIAVDHPIMTSSFTVKTPDYNTFSDFSGSYRISSSFGLRVPFEAIVDPENYLGGATIVDYEPHLSASINSTSSWDGGGDLLYKSAMHNFTSEVPKFFLRSKKGPGRVTTIVSARDDDRRYFKAELGKEYRMRVVLRNGRISRKRQLLSSEPPGVITNKDTSVTGAFFTQPTITMYDRRSAFGPPVHTDFIKYNESYEPFTPPYMDGYADVEMVFRPTETRYYFIDEIVSELTSSYFRVGEQYYNSGSTTSVARQNQMHISSSVNLLEVLKIKKGVHDAVGNTISIEDEPNAPSVAVIQPKWETPILDFSDTSVTLPISGSGSVSRGMWHQYGSEPGRAKGIYLEVQDLKEEEMTTPELTSSLADLMGFSKRPVKLGRVASERRLREAVVAIPYYQRNNEKKYFKIPRDTIDNALGILSGVGLSGASPNVPGQSIVDMVRKMKHYIFPPKLDFLTNETIEPFAVYIFEFQHVLSRQDLVDIWQNLSPDIGRSFKTSTATIKHDVLEGELLKGVGKQLRWMVFKVKQRASSNYYQMLLDSTRRRGFEFDYLRGVAKDTQEYDYTFNWPYDYFSLVEMVKLEAETDIEPTRPQLTPGEFDRRRRRTPLTSVEAHVASAASTQVAAAQIPPADAQVVPTAVRLTQVAATAAEPATAAQARPTTQTAPGQATTAPFSSPGLIYPGMGGGSPFGGNY